MCELKVLGRERLVWWHIEEAVIQVRIFVVLLVVVVRQRSA